MADCKRPRYYVIVIRARTIRPRTRANIQRVHDKVNLLYIPAVRNYCVIHSRYNDSSLVTP